MADTKLVGDNFKGNPQYAQQLGEDGMVELEGIVNGYVYLYKQSARAWTFELDLRTSKEKW